MSDCLHCALRERSEFCWWLKKRKKESKEEREAAPSPGLDGWCSERRVHPPRVLIRRLGSGAFCA